MYEKAPFCLETILLRGISNKLESANQATKKASFAMVLSHINGAERTEKMQKLFIRCSCGDESRLGGDEGLRGTCKERMKRMSCPYVTDK